MIIEEKWSLKKSNKGEKLIIETHSPTGGDLTNLLLLELLHKQNKQIQRQSEQLQRMIEARERAPKEDNSHVFKKLANHNPPMYNGPPDPKTFEDWIRGMEKLFNPL